MVFSPVTSGLYSLMALGRMWMAFISLLSRTFEVLAKILARQNPSQSDPSSPLASEKPDLPEGPLSGAITTSPAASTSASPVDPPQSPVEQFQKSPFQSTWSVATQVINPKKLRESHRTTSVDISQELPHRMHTRAIIAGAVAIHVPKRFTRLLRLRNWDRLSEDVREITTEHSRLPSSDPLFEELAQFILPPTALLLDSSLRLYPEIMFREALAGLLQLGFGLYQLISSDARYSVARDGLASPFMIVLPYLGMAAVNTVINVLDPPYSVVTVLDISPAARYAVSSRASQQQSLASSRGEWSTGFFSRASSFTDLFPLKLPSKKRKDSKDKEPEMKPKTRSTFSTVTEKLWVSSPTVRASHIIEGAERATWPEFLEWMTFAYNKRIDISPVDRLYRTPWLSHSIIIGECIYSAVNGLLIPLVILAVVGGWTGFQTSNHGLSLIFNLLAIFALPFLQFLLFSHYLFVRVKREMRGRREHGADYWEAEIPGENDRRQPRRKERHLWWDTIAQSIGIYFPIHKGVVMAYVIFIMGVAVCEFAFVGINLIRTYGCRGVI